MEEITELSVDQLDELQDDGMDFDFGDSNLFQNDSNDNTVEKENEKEESGEMIKESSDETFNKTKETKESEEEKKTEININMEMVLKQDEKEEKEEMVNHEHVDEEKKNNENHHNLSVSSKKNEGNEEKKEKKEKKLQSEEEKKQPLSKPTSKKKKKKIKKKLRKAKSFSSNINNGGKKKSPSPKKMKTSPLKRANSQKRIKKRLSNTSNKKDISEDNNNKSNNGYPLKRSKKEIKALARKQIQKNLKSLRLERKRKEMEKKKKTENMNNLKNKIQEIFNMKKRKESMIGEKKDVEKTMDLEKSLNKTDKSDKTKLQTKTKTKKNEEKFSVFKRTKSELEYFEKKKKAIQDYGEKVKKMNLIKIKKRIRNKKRKKRQREKEEIERKQREKSFIISKAIKEDEKRGKNVMEHIEEVLEQEKLKNGKFDERHKPDSNIISELAKVMSKLENNVSLLKKANKNESLIIGDLGKREKKKSSVFGFNFAEKEADEENVNLDETLELEDTSKVEEKKEKCIEDENEIVDDVLTSTLALLPGIVKKGFADVNENLDEKKKKEEKQKNEVNNGTEKVNEKEENPSKEEEDDPSNDSAEENEPVNDFSDTQRERGTVRDHSEGERKEPENKSADFAEELRKRIKEIEDERENKRELSKRMLVLEKEDDDDEDNYYEDEEEYYEKLNGTYNENRERYAEKVNNSIDNYINEIENEDIQFEKVTIDENRKIQNNSEEEEEEKLDYSKFTPFISFHNFNGKDLKENEIKVLEISKNKTQEEEEEFNNLPKTEYIEVEVGEKKEEKKVQPLNEKSDEIVQKPKIKNSIEEEEEYPEKKDFVENEFINSEVFENNMKTQYEKSYERPLQNEVENNFDMKNFFINDKNDGRIIDILIDKVKEEALEKEMMRMLQDKYDSEVFEENLIKSETERIEKKSIEDEKEFERMKNQLKNEINSLQTTIYETDRKKRRKKIEEVAKNERDKFEGIQTNKIFEGNSYSKISDSVNNIPRAFNEEKNKAENNLEVKNESVIKNEDELKKSFIKNDVVITETEDSTDLLDDEPENLDEETKEEIIKKYSAVLDDKPRLSPKELHQKLSKALNLLEDTQENRIQLELIAKQKEVSYQQRETVTLAHFLKSHNDQSTVEKSKLLQEIETQKNTILEMQQEIENLKEKNK